MNKQINYKGANIAYTVDGSGKAVVLLHGFLEDLIMWNEFTTKLLVTNKVVAIDLPGFGNSGMIDNNHSMTLMAKVVEAVIENEGISKCTMIGHSMGGYVALAYAKLYENKLSGVVLFHSQGRSDDDEAVVNRNRTIKVVENSHTNFISNFIPTLFTDENAIKYSIEIKQIIARSLLTKNEGIIAALLGMRDRHDQLELLTKLEIPILFIAGKKDIRIPIDRIHNQIGLAKFPESLILDDVGHMGFIEAKQITYDAIERFINK